MTDAKTVTEAIKSMTKAEAAHQASLDAINKAMTKRRFSDVPGLRQKLRESEQVLVECVNAAQLRHREYWLARKNLLIPELQRMGRIALEYDVMARASGESYVFPWKLVVDQAMHPSFPHAELVQEIPLEAPRSDLLDEEFGAWPG